MLINSKREDLVENARHFVDFPEVIFFDEFADYVEELKGTEIINFEADGIFEIWLEFTFQTYRFFVINRLGDYRFYVEDEKCSDEILLEIANHFRKLLERNDSATEDTEYLEGLH